jgi:anti-sigma B factor antagonist
MPDRTPSDDTTRLSIASHEAAVFELVGEIDAHTAPHLASHFDPLPSEVRDVLVLDMSDVSFMDSSGLRVLIELNQRAGEAGVGLTVRSPSRAVARLIEISGLDGVIEVSST